MEKVKPNITVNPFDEDYDEENIENGYVDGENVKDEVDDDSKTGVVIEKNDNKLTVESRALKVKSIDSYDDTLNPFN